MKQYSNEVNPITPRANAKIVKVGNRVFLVGGMTADKVTNDIYEIRTVEDNNETKIQWKPMKFKNNVFKSRNSYSACGSLTKIYIWGGLQSKQVEQICLHNIIEVDIEKQQMKQLNLKQNIKIHSSALIYDQQQNQLLAIGGTNEDSTMQTFLYTLKLDKQLDQYQWKKVKLDCEEHKGYLWQHTAHLSNFSYFTMDKGKFLTVIGGCHYPQSPYDSIVQFDLQSMKKTNSIKMKAGLVSHDSIASKTDITIFGGATGGDFNNNIITLSNGKLKYEKGHNAVGCSCFSDEISFYIIGGVSGPESLNRVVIYKKSK